MMPFLKMIKYKMLEYDRINISEGIDVNESPNFRECSQCSFHYFIDQNFNYQEYFWDGCHDMSMKAMSMKNLVIIYSKENACRVNFAFMTINEATNSINNSTLISKRGVL